MKKVILIPTTTTVLSPDDFTTKRSGAVWTTESGNVMYDSECPTPWDTWRQCHRCGEEFPPEELDNVNCLCPKCFDIVFDDDDF